MATYTVNVQLRTSDGRPLCDAAADGGTYTFAAISLDAEMVDEFTCPLDNLVVENVPEGTYTVGFLRQDLVPNGFERLPQFWIGGPYTVDGEETFNVRLRGTTELAGRALFEGEPNRYATITFKVDDELPTIAFNANGEGEWVDPDFAWAPALLQKEITYGATCRGGLGTRSLYFEFSLPDTRKVDCRSPESRFASISHTGSRVILSTEPATLNYGEYDEFEIGNSWGVQFTDDGNPITSPEANVLFQSSLVLALENGSILSGSAVGACGECEDFSNVLNLKHGRFSEGRRVTWVYDDSNSEEGVGLRVTQRSYDGNGLDYVMFHYSFENTSAEPVTFNPGVYFDWDIGEYEDNMGGTEMDGRLMYVTDPNDVLPYMGTVIVNSEPAGNYFLQSGDGTSVAAQVAVMRGDARRVSSSDTDVSYFHSAAEMTVLPGRSRGLWLAVVGGTSLDELIATATSAITEFSDGHYTRRTQSGIMLGDAEMDADVSLPVPPRVGHKPLSGRKPERCESGRPNCSKEAMRPSVEQLQAAARSYLKAMKK